MARRRSLIEDAKFEQDVINVAPIEEDEVSKYIKMANLKN